MDGYHSIPLDEESQPLITFIMAWSHFMYLRMPQGYLASGDAYTHRYNKMKDVPRKVKMVNDTLLFDKNIEAFFHTVDYLLLWEKNGILLREKFQFCQFGGLLMEQYVHICVSLLILLICIY